MRGNGRSKRNSCSHVRGLLGEKRGQFVHMWRATLKKWNAVLCNAMGPGGEGERRQWRPLKLTWTNKISVYNIHQCSQLLSLTLYYFMGYSTGPYRGWHRAKQHPTEPKVKVVLKKELGDDIVCYKVEIIVNCAVWWNFPLLVFLSSIHCTCIQPGQSRRLRNYNWLYHVPQLGNFTLL